VEIIVFLGAPGSGKGTQAKSLAQTQGFRHFSTGDMLRSAMASKSPLGLRAKEYIDKGELVPDNVMIELIEGALAPLDPKSRVILDGFPRTVPQAQALDGKTSTSVARALFFKMPEAALVQRLTGRRICEKCGESFHTVFLPPKQSGVCDKCGGKLIQRTDDSEEVVRRRLQIFAAQNDQLLGYYGERKNLRELNADQPVAVVQKSLGQILS